jgi:hypothetical protein
MSAGGALLGGAAGAATGALTKEKDLDLGKPIWKITTSGPIPAPIGPLSLRWLSPPLLEFIDGDHGHGVRRG